MNRGSTPCFSPTSKMMRSNCSSPELGMSAGMAGMANSFAGLAAATGASTWLKRMPVRLVKRKSAIIAKGANFNERKWGNLRGNFIQQNLHGHSDDHKGHQISYFLRR